MDPVCQTTTPRGSLSDSYDSMTVAADPRVGPGLDSPWCTRSYPLTVVGSRLGATRRRLAQSSWFEYPRRQTRSTESDFEDQQLEKNRCAILRPTKPCRLARCYGFLEATVRRCSGTLSRMTTAMAAIAAPKVNASAGPKAAHMPPKMMLAGSAPMPTAPL